MISIKTYLINLINRSPKGYPFLQVNENNITLQSLREILLIPWLNISVIIGTPLIAIAIIQFFQNRNIVALIIYSVIYTDLLVITFIRRIPHTIRAVNVFIIIFVLACVNLFTEGLNVDAGLFLLSLITLTTLLFGLKNGMRALLLSSMVVSVVGFLIVTDRIQVEMSLPQNNSLLWISGVLVLMITGAILSVSMGMLIDRLDKNQKDAIARASSADVRVRQLIDSLFALSKFDFNQPATVTENGDPFDALAERINWVAEELNTSTLALRKNEKRLAYLISSNPAVIYTAKPLKDRAITFISENVSLLFGYKADEFVQDPMFWINHINPQDVDSVLVNFSTINLDEHFIHEYRFLHKEGHYIWVRDEKRVICNSDGRPTEIIGSIIGINEQKIAEEQVKSSLQEKEILLREIYHRVKNNLQVIISLLNLQSTQFNSDEQYLGELCQDMRQRISSMALVHEKLYQSNDLSKIAVKDYVQTLCESLINSYRSKTNPITLKLQVDQIYLGPDTVIPCGLIINELVTNSLKHAFPNSGNQKILGVSLSEIIDNHFRLIVSDNGIGLPNNIDPHNTKTLGLQLVNLLVEQLNGTMKIVRRNGTQFHITFSEINYKKRGQVI
ncbi:MAG: hypothetical protein C0410_09415 [Anaerolinea sp.]|nr:hypothetical protein [Anaerolinea sp.]